MKIRVKCRYPKSTLSATKTRSMSSAVIHEIGQLSDPNSTLGDAVLWIAAKKYRRIMKVN